MHSIVVITAILSLVVVLPWSISSAASTKPTTSVGRRIHQGWEACRMHQCWNISSLPTTALMALLERQQQQQNSDDNNDNILSTTNIRPEDLYRSKNMERLPDISTVGRDFYTLVYQWKVPRLMKQKQQQQQQQESSSSSSSWENQSLSPSSFTARQILRISGINYRAQAFWKNQPLMEVNQQDHDDGYLDGMFRRRHYDLTTTTITASHDSDDGNDNKKQDIFQIRIEPPLHPGIPVHGQGGNHDLAMDGPTAQFMLGWDWCQAMPDRATGFFGDVQLHTTFGPMAILDPAVQTIELECDETTTTNIYTNTTTKGSSCTKVKLVFQAHIECAGVWCEENQNGPVVLKVTSDWGEVWHVEATLLAPRIDDSITTIGTDIQSPDIVVQHPEKIHPWWPHGLETEGDTAAHLHTFHFEILEATGHLVSDDIVIQTGIRTVETYLDDRLQGQVFSINGQKIYLVGGNWITTDQALRFSASKERYCNELALFRHAGLSLVRVWGGGVAETTDFYECADQLGILVFQEFWMTGDNNGRWAGDYNWPLDHTTYIANVEDTIRRLRQHPSLLFYGGCNECLAPRTTFNPPLDIDTVTRSLIAKLDPGRFYISSSMGGKNRADTFEDPTLWANRTFSLSFADGPYQFLMPEQFFERNPGLEFKNISIGFQPEIGSTSAPTYNGLLRFMTKNEAGGGFPSRNASNDDVGDVWKYHKYQSWKTGNVYDHVYAYLDPDTNSNTEKFANASEWCAAAQLAAHRQYQHLFEGFISHIFDYTSAVILWKAQSPWPALRGFLYDWYLEATGTLFGTRAALNQLVSVSLDMSSWRVRMINRSRRTLVNFPHIVINYQWISTSGTIVERGLIRHPDQGNIQPMSALLIGDSNDALVWPNSCGEVCLLQLTPSLGSSVDGNKASTWYWIPNPTLDVGNEFAALGRMRSRQQGQASLHIASCWVTHDGTLQVDVRIRVPADSKDPLFYPVLSIYANNEQILPLFDASTNQVLILAGNIQERRLTTSPIFLDPKTIIEARMDTWNGGTIGGTSSCASSTTRPPKISTSS